MERRNRVPLPSEEGSKSFVCQDPRRFKFAIICKKCDLKFATMQEARAHFQECTSGKSVDVMCGHCEMRTSLWSAMCAHLNQSGMQKQVACRPEYRMTPPPRVEFPQTTPFIPPPTSPLAMAMSSHPVDVRSGVGGGGTQSHLPSPHLDRRHGISATRNCGRLYATGGVNTPAVQSYEGLGGRCPPFRWNRLRAGATACQPPRREVSGMSPQPVLIHRRLTRPHWRLRVPGYRERPQDCSPL